jgi:hypothetical protein
MLNRSKFAIKKALGLEFSLLESMLVQFENPAEMGKWFAWENEPKLSGEGLHDFATDFTGVRAESESVNLRMLRDAEVVCGVTANLAEARLIEVGESVTQAGAAGWLADDQRAETLYDETRAALATAKPGDYIVWHEFNLALAPTHHYIYEVCVGLEELCRSGLLEGKIYQLRDSWVLLYCVPAPE